MHASIHINMTAGEILVLAAAMGFETVYGIEPVRIGELKNGLKDWVLKQFNSLTDKGIVEYSIDGVLYVREAVKRSVEAICKAHTVVMIDDNVNNGKKESIRELYCADYKVTLKKLSGEANYEITLLDDKDSMILTRYLFADIQPGTEIHGRIDAKELYRLKGKIQSFLKDEASEDLRQIMPVDEANFLESMLDSGSKYVLIKVFKRRDRLFECVLSDILSVGSSLVKLSENNGLIHFDTIPMDAIIMDVSTVIDEFEVGSHG